jgi:hypothetical protein
MVRRWLTRRITWRLRAWKELGLLSLPGRLTMVFLQSCSRLKSQREQEEIRVRSTKGLCLENGHFFYERIRLRRG